MSHSSPHTVDAGPDSTAVPAGRDRKDVKRITFTLNPSRGFKPTLEIFATTVDWQEVGRSLVRVGSAPTIAPPKEKLPRRLAYNQ